ncbi:kinase-like domain-containing protein [Gilbertella persicaria]|uniref:kinase-like domain-containing protein n=1 Tax=Gilbertella persicaria TaxID=101096 RepID=UPI0022212136|nr:kinase-like domain-containing protein [Gilbertella persicaria]KAI8075838.1 kinase-like domain-containing protein [Gilbertella persicaria]
MSTTFSPNLHRLSPGDMWLPDQRASSLITNDLAKQQANLPNSSFLAMSENSSTTSSSNSSVLSNNLSRQSSIASKRHRADTASLKEYGECYRRLGQGTAAVVMVIRKLGEDGRSEKLYAIKQFRKKQKHESEKEYMKKLTSEFCISSTFSHPNVVQTIDLVLDDKKRYCTVMEYCPGGDLFTIIMTERMSETEKVCCFKQLLQGLAYLHSMGVAHRDIKPENLLLTMDGKLKITDFGVSDVYRFPWESKGRQSRGLVGSEPYIAPEAFEQKEYWGSTADVWSAGIVFYCMWVGGLAWHKARKTDSAYCGYIRAFEKNQIFDLFKTLGPNERRILHRMLDPHPSHRITTAELLRDPWIQSISTCENSIDIVSGKQHKHTEGIQPICVLSKK